MSVIAIIQEDAYAEDLGKKIVSRALSKAGVKDDEGEVIPLVLISDTVEAALANELREDGKCLLLFGAPDVSHLRQRLFGTLPEKIV